MTNGQKAFAVIHLYLLFGLVVYAFASLVLPLPISPDVFSYIMGYLGCFSVLLISGQIK